MELWDTVTGQKVQTLRGHLGPVRTLAFGPDGKRLAIAGLFGQLLTGEVRILDAEDAHEIWSLRGHTLIVGDAVFSPDGLRLATASGDRTIRIWDFATGQEILKLSGDSTVYTVRFVTGGRRLIGASAEGTIRVWDATPLPE